MATDTTDIDRALEDPNEDEKEAADVDRWQRKVKQARKYDADARRRYAMDRRYARGDSGFMVDDNIIGTNIDILESFLYARDPDLSVTPARCTQPPSKDAIEDAVLQAFEAAGGRPPEIAAAGQQAAAVAVAEGMGQMEALQAGQLAEAQATDAYIEAQFEQVRKRYETRQRNAKAFATTLEIAGSHSWRRAKLKPRGRRMVRSGLTIGVGIIKGSWQERTEPSPETTTAINDLQTEIKQAARLREDMDEQTGSELDALMAEYQRHLESLRAEPERVVARGYAIDLVNGEDFQVAPGYTIADHCDAPWNAHRIPMLKEDAQAEFGLAKKVIDQATIYTARKPVMVRDRSANEEVETSTEAITDADADGFTTGGTSRSPDAEACEGSGDWVMVWEVWDRITGSVLTYIEGIRRWVRKPWKPTATERFYPFFVYAMSEVDGQRHPQSPVSRASKLVDAYYRMSSQEEEHRRRCLPKILFHKGQLNSETMNRVTTGQVGEYVGVETTTPGINFNTLFFAAPYAPIDPALYDRQRLLNGIERIFGVQEALGGSVSVAKTATEADIQQQGFNARTGSRRDTLEALLGEFAIYTCQVLRAHMTAEEVRAIAGPDALWPEYGGPEELDAMVSIEIRAGSTGKPNTAAQREALTATLPLLKEGIERIGLLRNSLPEDMANSHVRLLEMVTAAMGDRIDLDELVPKMGPPPAPVPPPGAPGAPTGAPGGAPSQQQPGAAPVPA